MAEHGAAEPSALPASVPTELIEELAAIGAAVGSNCEPCLAFHHDRARRLGLTNEQLAVAVTMAQRVKNAPAEKILGLAATLLQVNVETLTPRPRS